MNTDDEHASLKRAAIRRLAKPKEAAKVFLELAAFVENQDKVLRHHHSVIATFDKVHIEIANEIRAMAQSIVWLECAIKHIIDRMGVDQAEINEEFNEVIAKAQEAANAEADAEKKRLAVESKKLAQIKDPEVS